MMKIAIDIDNTICNTSEFFGIAKVKNKYKYLDDCDYFVDDAIDNCEQALEYSNCKVILMVTNRTKDYKNDNIFKAINWKDIYDYIVLNKESDKA